MKARINLCSLFLCLYIGIYAQKKAYKYPESKIIPQADTFFNTPVSDPYRWLENTNSPETKEWIQQQCRFSEKHLAKLSGRIGIKEELIRASDFSYQLPYKWGKYFLSDYYNSRINSSVLLVKNKYHKDFSYLCDFAGKYANEKTILKDCRINAGQNIVACITSKNGSDWCEIELVKLRSGNKMKDRLKNIMHSSIAWKGDGFYYSRYRAPDKRSERIVLSENQQVYFHKIGSAQEEDSLVFQRSESPLSVFTTETTYDERFLIIDEWCSEERRSTTYYRDFAAGENNIKPLNSHYDYYFSVIDNIKDELLVLTNHKAYNKRAVLINPRQPNVWKTFIPEDPKAMLMGIVMLKDKIVAKYQLKNKQFLIFYDYSGNVLQNGFYG